MSMRHSRLPVSGVNAVLVGVLLLAAVGAAVAGRWSQAVPLMIVGLVALASALHARRHGSGDVTRVNAIEYRDERDRKIARDGFATVGVVALVLSGIAFVVVSMTGREQASAPALNLVVSGQLLVLAVVWALANYAAARRH
jgi:hypothetical protein